MARLGHEHMAVDSKSSSALAVVFFLEDFCPVDKSGKCLTEEKEILSRWTEYCSELYNSESCGDNAVLDCSQPLEEDLQPILREEVEIAVASLKKGKSAGVDNIPAELVQAGGETMIDVLIEICNRI